MSRGTVYSNLWLKKYFVQYWKNLFCINFLTNNTGCYQTALSLRQRQRDMLTRQVLWPVPLASEVTWWNISVMFFFSNMEWEPKRSFFQLRFCQSLSSDRESLWISMPPQYGEAFITDVPGIPSRASSLLVACLENSGPLIVILTIKKKTEKKKRPWGGFNYFFCLGISP